MKTRFTFLLTVLALLGTTGCNPDDRDTKETGAATVPDVPTAQAPTDPLAPADNCTSCEELRKRWVSSPWHILGFDHPESIAALEELTAEWKSKAEQYGPNSETALFSRERLVIAYEQAQMLAKQELATEADVVRLEGLLK